MHHVGRAHYPKNFSATRTKTRKKYSSENKKRAPRSFIQHTYLTSVLVGAEKSRDGRDDVSIVDYSEVVLHPAVQLV